MILSFSCNFFVCFKFLSDLGRVIGKIKQNELDCRDTAPLKVMLHETIRNYDFERNTALQCWNNVATIRNNVATML